MAKAVAKKEVKIKYTDKSKGQEHLIPIFDAIKKLMMLYEKGNIELHGGIGGKVILVSRKSIQVEGSKFEEVWFASALI